MRRASASSANCGRQTPSRQTRTCSRNNSAEGFNTKVRLLMKQSYGLRDFKYLKLKIMDLPSRKIRVSI